MPKMIAGWRQRCELEWAGTPRGHRHHLVHREVPCQDCRDAFLLELKFDRLRKGITTRITLSKEELAKLFEMVWEQSQLNFGEANPYLDGLNVDHLERMYVGRV